MPTQGTGHPALGYFVGLPSSAQPTALQYVYTGNVHDSEGGTTFCPQCHAALIVRDWYRIDRYEVTPESKCPHCATTIKGEFEVFNGQFGRRRIPIAINQR